MASFRSLKSAIFDREEKKQQYQAHIRGLNAYDRHKKFLNGYEEDDMNPSWEQRLVKRYYDKLFKDNLKENGSLVKDLHGAQPLANGNNNGHGLSLTYHSSSKDAVKGNYFGQQRDIVQGNGAQNVAPSIK